MKSSVVTEAPVRATARTSEAKERLLQVGFDLIWTQSYGSVGVEEICERARVHKGSFYHYFPSKADLALEAHEENWRERQPVLDRIFSPQNPPVERLRQWCAHLQERQRQKAEKYGHVCGCPYGSLGVELATQDERIRAKIQELTERHIKYLESALVDVQRQNLAPIKDPSALAVQVYSAVLGMMLLCKIRNNLELLRYLEPTVLGLVGIRQSAN